MTGGELSARTEAEKYREWAHRDLVAAGIIQSLLDALDAAEARVAAVEAERNIERHETSLVREARGEAMADVEHWRARAERLATLVEDLRANPRDEFHTMAELYDYRMLYNALAFNALATAGDVSVCKSWRHSSGEECFGGGWFIVVAELSSGQVSNHYKAEHWDLFQVPAVDLPPEYDGHTPAQAADRLRAALGGTE